jgi:hypothetical protein
MTKEIKVEIFHKPCGQLVFYCDHHPDIGDINVGGLTKLSGIPVIKGEFIFCQKCGGEVTTANVTVDISKCKKCDWL